MDDFFDLIKEGMLFACGATAFLTTFLALLFGIFCLIVALLPDSVIKEIQADNAQYKVEHPEEYDCRKKPEPMPVVVPVVMPMR
jgi:hypothetical protein